MTVEADAVARAILADHKTIISGQQTILKAVNASAKKRPSRIKWLLIGAVLVLIGNFAYPFALNYIGAL